MCPTDTKNKSKLRRPIALGIVKADRLYIAAPDGALIEGLDGAFHSISHRGEGGKEGLLAKYLVAWATLIGALIKQRENVPKRVENSLRSREFSSLL